jgi:aryl-alcohol dehydrogenase-like predicted oxidoreductase
MTSLLQAKEIFPELSVFQVPENICDRRLIDSRVLLDLNAEGDRVIVRSVFLQGLLLMPLDKIPTKLDGAYDILSQLRDFAAECGVTVLDLCLGYAKSIPWASGIVIGVVNAQQIIQVVESEFQLPICWESKIGSLPANVLDPRKW